MWYCLKKSHSIEEIKQIKDADYHHKVSDYSWKIIFVGINYDRSNKRHTCKIEKITK